MQEVILYASPASLYSGKARSYLVKAGIPFREVFPRTRRFLEVVVPKAGTMTLPTIELANGTVVRDSTRIIDHFEAHEPRFAPRSPRQSVVSLLFDVIGSEGLLRPAMHYRWNFPEANEAFIRRHAEMMAPDGVDAGPLATAGMKRMRRAAVAFGVNPEIFAGIESLYAGFLALLDAHFAEHGYLLGGKPSIGDFGLIAPLYAHLGRDPYPLRLMQTKAVHAFRWVERMNRPDPDIGELTDDSCEHRADDEVPETLRAVLRYVARDLVPETVAAADCINLWLRAKSPVAGSPVSRSVGAMAEFEAAGMAIRAIAQPYRFFLLKRVQAAVDALDPQAKRSVLDLLEHCDLSDLLDARLDREIGWDDNREVWR